MASAPFSIHRMWPEKRTDTYKEKATTSCLGQPDAELGGEESWLRHGGCREPSLLSLDK